MRREIAIWTRSSADWNKHSGLPPVTEKVMSTMLRSRSSMKNVAACERAYWIRVKRVDFQLAWSSSIYVEIEAT